MIKGYIQILLASLMLGVSVHSHALTITGGNSYSRSFGGDINFSFRVDVDDAYAWVEGMNEPEVTNVSYNLWTAGFAGSDYDNIVGALTLYESSADTGTMFADSDTDSWSFLGSIPITPTLGWFLSADQDQLTVFGDTYLATGDGFFLRDYEGSLPELTLPFPTICFTSCFVSVPEPSAFLLMGVGLLGLRFSRQR